MSQRQPLAAVVVRWDTPTAVSVLVDGRVVITADSSDDFPGEAPLGPARITAEAAASVAAAFGADVQTEGPAR